jgi:hypothetical protein
MSSVVINNQGTLWDSWANRNGGYVKYNAKGPCGKTGGCLGIASGCRTDQPYIDPMGRLQENTTFDIPVWCNTCGYVGNFPVYKLDLDEVNVETDTPVRPVRGRSSTAVNQGYLDALDILNNKENEAHVLELVRSRTEQWAATTAALTSLFGIGSILILMTSLPDMDHFWRNAIACLLLSGLFCSAASTFLQIPTRPVIPKVDRLHTTFKEDLYTERTKRALKELDDLEVSRLATLLGLVLISIGMVLRWIAPKTDNDSEFSLNN